MKIPKWQHELARYYKRGKLVSYFLNNAAKTCLFGLKISENIEIGHVFQPRAFFHRSSNLHTSCLSTYNDTFIDWIWWYVNETICIKFSKGLRTRRFLFNRASYFSSTYYTFSRYPNEYPIIFYGKSWEDLQYNISWNI